MVLYHFISMFFKHVSGSVIKHQLVTHLSLGIALRYVLDALRKPADSKVCVILKSGLILRFVRCLFDCVFICYRCFCLEVWHWSSLWIVL